MPKKSFLTECETEPWQLKNTVFWDVCADVSEERIAFLIRVVRISELGTTLPVNNSC
jgi:hypothetical protein